MKSKEEIRKDQLKRRAEMTADDLFERSEVIKYKSLSLISQLPEVKTIHCFLPSEKFNEPNTWFLVQALWEEFPHVQVCAPVCEWEGAAMESYLLGPDTLVKQTSLKIPEPIDSPLIKPEQIDLIFVPLLAYNKGLHRIGYGKGFYDRYLSRCREDCIKVGISLWGAEEFEADEFDVALDLVVSAGE